MVGVRTAKVAWLLTVHNPGSFDGTGECPIFRARLNFDSELVRRNRAAVPIIRSARVVGLLRPARISADQDDLARGSWFKDLFVCPCCLGEW
jgi:hypothetical protein